MTTDAPGGATRFPPSPRFVFECMRCRFRSVTWRYGCPSCGAMGAFLESAAAAGEASPDEDGTAVVAMADVDADVDAARFRSGVRVWDTALGGGQPPGTVVILGGDPGIGKSTLALQVLVGLQRRGAPRALYVASEEPIVRVRQRGDRIGVSTRNLFGVAEQLLPAIEAAARAWGPQAIVVDSVQAVYDPAFPGAPGSVSQVRRAGWRLVRLARDLAAAAIVLAHVDKAGEFAGPMVLQHDVDAVAMLEGTPDDPERVLRVRKNRFGPTTDVGRCAMTEKGLR